jgi:2Fe-2S ferredoxin
MRAAVDHGLSGIMGECGGELTCASCHVHVDDAWYGRYPVVGLAESELLEMVDNLRPTSRLSCQLVLRDDLDGTVVTIP